MDIKSISVLREVLPSPRKFPMATYTSVPLKLGKTHSQFMKNAKKAPRGLMTSS